MSIDASMGNYKGIMLSNRPFASTGALNNAGSKGNGFTCGKVSEPLGIGASQVPAIFNMTDKIHNRTKKVSVVAKHRKWLAELQKAKEENDLKYETEQKIKEDNLKKFMDNEAKKRQKELIENTSDTTTSIAINDSKSTPFDMIPNSSQNKLIRKSSKADNKLSNSSSRPVSATEAKNCDSSSSRNSGNIGVLGGNSITSIYGSPMKSTTKVKNKPKWAMTEQEATPYVSEEKKSNDNNIYGNTDFGDEENDLLNFANTLNYDKYMNDIEVQTMMERLQSRIYELEKDISIDIQREEESKQQRLKNNMMINDGSYDYLLDDSASTDTDDDDRQLIESASKLLHYTKKSDSSTNGNSIYDVNAIHSKRSMAAVIKNVKDEESKSATILNEPVIVVHDPAERVKELQKFDVSKLPYMHRNPAI